ncbi:MAG: TonB-dependent receptor [Spirosomataceae bacterium]
MRATILFSTLLVAFTKSFGQISGKAINAKNEPILFANVSLFDAKDSSLVAGATTDEEGAFLIASLKIGLFYIQISSIGYKNSKTQSFIIDNANTALKLPTITLLEEINALNEVTISAKKEWNQHTPIGKVIHIQSSLMTKGSNALQVLERLPGVITDRRNNQLSLNGQSGITILFNGRKMPMSMEELMVLLESTVADNIEKIELITSPTAQYDADGSAGVINIIFKKNENEGTKMNFSMTGGYGYREKAVISIGLSQGFKKADVYASYSFLHDVSKSGFRGEGTSDKTFLLSANTATFSGITRRFQNTHNANLTTEFRPNTKTTFGSDFTFSFANTHNLVNNDVIWEFKEDDYLGFKALSDGLNKRQSIFSSVYFKRKISKKSQLNTDASYIHYETNSPALIEAEYFDREKNKVVPYNPLFTSGNRGESVSKIQAGLFKADYTAQLSDKISAEFGVKGSISKNTNDSKIERKTDNNWEIDTRSQSVIYSKEKIGAVYLQCKFILSSKSNLHAGLRYEYWQRDFNLYKEAFTTAKLFPSLFYTYQLNDNANFSINYNRRISRPAYTDLISNLFYNDPTFIFSGNPLLKPTLTDVLKADFVIKGLNVGLSLQHDLHPILRYQITTNETKDIGISSPQNVDYQKSINLFLNYPIQIFDWWKLSISSTTSLRNYKISYSLAPAKKTFVFENVNFNQTIRLPKSFEVELSGWYNFPFFEGANSLKGFGIMNLGIAKKLKKDKGTLQLSLPDLLQSFSVYTHISGMTPIVFNINTVSNWRDETAFYRIIKLNYSRSFGKPQKSVKYSTSDEERERVR